MKASYVANYNSQLLSVIDLYIESGRFQSDSSNLVALQSDSSNLVTSGRPVATSSDEALSHIFLLRDHFYKWREEGTAAGCYEREMAMSSSDLAELEDLVDSFYREEEDDEQDKDDVGSERSGWLTRAGKETAVTSGVDDRKERLAAVLAESEADSVARRIRAEAERAVRVAGRRGDGSFKRRLVVRLRDKGFDAGVCKSSWEREDGGMPAGDHEFIDVIDRSGGARYILETDFAAEFQIARPSSDYAALLRWIPLVFVGSPGVVEGVVSIMCAAVKESVGRSGMHLPPWRRREYVRAKWLGSYKRINGSIGELQKEKEGLDDTISSMKKEKIGRIELRCRDLQVRKGMLAVELSSMSKGYGF